MRANVSFIASNLSDAREKANQAFQDFFGDQPFEIIEEEAESHAVIQTDRGDSRVVSWRSDFTAEGAEA